MLVIQLALKQIMYRPLKDLNGIPGAESLIICLTGYQRQDRDDIMVKVFLSDLSTEWVFYCTLLFLCGSIKMCYKRWFSCH